MCVAELPLKAPPSVAGLTDVKLLFDDIDWQGDRLDDPVKDDDVEPREPTEGGCGGYILYGWILRGLSYTHAPI